MGYLADVSSTQGTTFIICIVSLPVTTVAVALRFYATRCGGRRPAAEDWFALVSQLCFLGHTSILTQIMIAMDGRPAEEMVLSHAALFKTLRKETFFMLYLFLGQMFFFKLSIMALYHRIFSVNRTYVICISVILAMHVAWAVAMTALYALACRPLGKFFEPFMPGTCINTGIQIAVSESINSGIDFALVALAMLMIRSVNISSASKWKLRFLFGLGSFVGVIGILKIYFQYSMEAIEVYTVLGLWGTVQMGVAIICCCAPVYKPLLPEHGFFSRLAFKLSISKLQLSHNHSAVREQGSVQFLQGDNISERGGCSQRESESESIKGTLGPANETSVHVTRDMPLEALYPRPRSSG